jgi:hypothetical protein
MYLQCNLSEPGLSTGVDVSEIGKHSGTLFSRREAKSYG